MSTSPGIVPIRHVITQAAPAATPQLTYHQGPLLTSVEVYTIFWGESWQQAPQSNLVQQLNGFFDFILTSSLMDLLAEYSVPGKTIGHGQRVGTQTITSSDPSSDHLGMIVYGADGTGGYQTIFGSSDMGQGSGAIAWLIGDVNGDGRAEVVQLWNNGGQLGMIVYGADGTGGYQTIFGSSDMGQGSGAIAWLIGNVNNDGAAEVVQLWDNNARTITDGQIQQTLQNWINGSDPTGTTVPQPNSNTLFFIYLPPNATVVLPGAGNSCTGFCGYHFDINGTIFYAVVPFITCSGCTSGQNLPFDSLTEVSSHELCEAITDPQPLRGWNDDNRPDGEIGDICNFQATRLGGYNIQRQWSNSMGSCRVAP
jgi:hypothetical protein